MERGPGKLPFARRFKTLVVWWMVTCLFAVGIVAMFFVVLIGLAAIAYSL